MNAVMKAPRLVRYAAGLLALACSPVWAAGNGTEPVRWQLNLIPGVTETSLNAYNAHMIMLWICIVIGIVVFGAMGFAMFKFRHSKGAVPDTQFTHSTLLEALWTVIPIVILVGSAIPATRMVVSQYNADHTAKKAEMTIKVTGYQWMWRYEYVDQGVDFISRLDRESDRIRQQGSIPDEKTIPHYLRDVDRPLVLPANTRVRFVITADDVIHAWWVPALGWKQDAVPGVINEGWTEVKEPGTYRGVCAELCGKDHGFMPIVVKVVPKAEYQVWLAEQKAGSGEGVMLAATPVVEAGEAIAAEAAPTDAPAAAAEAAPDASTEAEARGADAAPVTSAGGAS